VQIASSRPFDAACGGAQDKLQPKAEGRDLSEGEVRSSVQRSTIAGDILS
jgi:hypothetical protein